MEILRIKEVIEKVKISRSTIRRLEQQGSFPKRRRISTRLVGWAVDEIEQWILTRK